MRFVLRYGSSFMLLELGGNLLGLYFLLLLLLLLLLISPIPVLCIV